MNRHSDANTGILVGHELQHEQHMLATGIQRKDLERGNQEPVGNNLQGSRLTQFNWQIKLDSVTALHS